MVDRLLALPGIGPWTASYIAIRGLGDPDAFMPTDLGTRDALAATTDVTIVDVLPALSVPEQDARFGPRLHDRDPSLCCRLRKVVPLGKALSHYDAWVTGIRRVESPTRADAPLISFDEAFKLVKVNPLATWTDEDLQAYIEAQGVKVNPLVEEGYP